MDYRRPGRTGLKVSCFCLGTMQWGWTADEPTAGAVMDAFVEHGGNFLDTADFYSRWLPGHFGDEIMTTSLLDRLTSKGHILEFVGESYRFRQRMQLEEQAASEQAR